MNRPCWILLAASLGAACTPADPAVVWVEVRAAVEQADAVAISPDGVEWDRCPLADGECSLSIPDGVDAGVLVEADNVVSCRIDLDEDADAWPGRLQVAAGYLPAEHVPYIGWDNPEGAGEPLFFGDPVDIWGACEDVEGDGVGEVLLKGLDGVLRVEGSELSKDGGGSGWCPPELSPIELGSRDGGTIWFRPL